MPLQHLPAADRAPRPWKNGGGITREVAVWPPGAGFEDFDWRISMADIQADGDFSPFPGVDRLLAVVSGGFRLSLGGQAPLDLGPGSPPASFGGDVPARAELAGGPVLDLNVMSRRGRFVARLVREDIHLPRFLALGALSVVVATGGPIRLADPDAAYDLDTHDALLISAPAAALIAEAATPTFAYVASFETA